MTCRILHVLAAEGFAIDQFSSRATAFNLIDHVKVAALPSMLIRLNVLATYALGDEEASLFERVRLVSPSNDTLAESQQKIELKARVADELPNHHLSIHGLWKTQLNTKGDHRLVVEHRASEDDDWVEVASTPITVVVQSHPILNAQAPTITAPGVPVPSPTSVTRG